MRRSYKSPFSFLKFVAISTTTLVLIFGYVFFTRHRVSYPCANSISCAKELSGMYDNGTLIASYHGRNITIPPQYYIPLTKSLVLGDATPTDKHIYVDLSKQRLYAYEGNRLVYTFLVSTGLWGRTPTGDFTIWIKLRYTRMTGGNMALGTYYDLPNVPYVMFFFNNEVPKDAGFSIHGTYWHDNFGHPMSHGCVNMKTEEVALLYNWANPTDRGSSTYASLEDPGTPITIYGTAPLD